jgi:hypothetical protein
LIEYRGNNSIWSQMRYSIQVLTKRDGRGGSFAGGKDVLHNVDNFMAMIYIENVDQIWELPIMNNEYPTKDMGRPNGQD